MTMPRLKHNYCGWQRQPEDRRDHIYQAPRRGTLPPRVNLVETLPKAYDQKNLGSCGPNTAAGDIQFNQAAQSLPMVMPSRLFIYYTTRQLMGTTKEDSGVNNRDMLKALANYGYPAEKNWPYKVRSFAKKPTKAIYSEAAKSKIKEYLAVPQTLADMKGCLAAGHPIIFGFNVFESIESPEVDQTGAIPNPQDGEEQLGGHDVLLVGYNDDTGVFDLRNSWGPRWGLQGYGTISYDYATDPLLAGDFWAIKHI